MMNYCLSRMIGSVIATFCLASCSFAGDENHVRVTVVDDFGTGINPIGTSLNIASATMRAAIAKGLVGIDEQGRVVPALAARWIVTDDGLSYIFRLNEAKWDDGRTVTAERIARLLRERFEELKNTRLGKDLRVVDEVVSMTGRVIEIRLRAPQPNFLQLLAQPEMGLFRAGHGAGPMRLISEENGLRLGLFDEPSSDPDADAEDEEERWVMLRSETAAHAIARFQEGQVDVIFGGRFHHLPLLDAAGLDSSNVQLDPVAGLFGFLFIRGDGFWSVPDNREILSMAINRPALLTSYPSVTAWRSRQKIVPEALDVEGIFTRPDWASMTMEDRISFARNHVSGWRNSEGSVDTLDVVLPNAAGADILFLRIRSDLRRVGLDIRRVNDVEQADVILIDEIAPHDSASWFLSRLTCDQTAVCLNDAGEKIAEAEDATNLDIKARLFAEAEQMLVQHYNFIPIGTPIRWSITRPGQRGFAVNPRGWHPLNTLVGIPIS